MTLNNFRKMYELCTKKYGVKQYPTLAYFPPGKSMYKYKFGKQRDYDNVKQWILENKQKEDETDNRFIGNLNFRSKIDVKDQEVMIRNIESELYMHKLNFL
jgi:predicted lipid-binding transport protein (Tim44 family)